MNKIISGIIFLIPVISNCANQKVEITLNTNPSTGYSWQSKCNPENGATVETVEKNKDSSKSGLVGASSQQIYRITKSSKKPVTCTFSYSRSWEKDVEPAQQFSIKL